MAGDIILETRGLTKEFKGFVAVNGVDLKVKRGTIHALIGPNGAGKTTFFNLLTKFLPPTSGQILYNGTDITTEKPAQTARRGIIRSFQISAVFPHLTVLENVTLAPRRVRKLAPAAARQRALELLERVGMQAHAHKHPFALSGGQQQRVAIARSLAMQPRVMLFDEPTSALDPEMVKEVLDVMQQLARSGMTMIVVTHEMGFAREVGDRILFFDHGRIAQDAPPAQFFGAQSDERVRAFIGQISR